MVNVDEAGAVAGGGGAWAVDLTVVVKACWLALLSIRGEMASLVSRMGLGVVSTTIS